MKPVACNTGALCALLAGLLGTPGAPRAQDPGEAARLRAEIARLQREIQRAEADARAADSLAREEHAAAERTRERLARDRARREKENADLEARVAETRARVAAERARGDRAAEASGEIGAREKALLAHLASVADSLLARIDTGMPWDLETRRARVLALRGDIQAGSAPPEEAFARLDALLRDEIRAGDEITLLSRPLTRATGEVINAQILRIGNQAIAYIDDEGKRFGLLERTGSGTGTAWAWNEEPGFSARNAIRRAVAVKAGREAPQLAPLDLSLAGLAGTPGATPSAQDTTAPARGAQGGR